MTTQAAFSPEEWQIVLEGPSTAGMIVITAAHGGTFRETIAMAKAYAEARTEHGDSELPDEIVATKPKVDHTRPPGGRGHPADYGGARRGQFLTQTRRGGGCGV